MRFVSQYPGYGAQIRVQRQRAIDGGGVEVLQNGLYVTFDPVHTGAMLYENERRSALDHFNFRGQTQDIGEAVPTDPMTRLSICDTDEWALREGWTDDEKLAVEARLTAISIESGEEVLLVSDTPISAPFPNYDTYEGDAQTLVLKLIEDGHDVEHVLSYEQVFGPKRPDVIEMLQDAVEVRKQMEVTA